MCERKRVCGTPECKDCGCKNARTSCTSDCCRTKPVYNCTTPGFRLHRKKPERMTTYTYGNTTHYDMVVRYYPEPVEEPTITPIIDGYYLADVENYSRDRVYKDVVLKFVQEDDPIFVCVSCEVPPGPAGPIVLKKHYKDWKND